MTLDECMARARRQLAQAGHTAAETRWMLRDIFGALKGYTEVDLVVRGGEEITDRLSGAVASAVERICAGEPLQYVTGQARFMGMTLRVTPDVLIPRPETEQLVDMIVDAAGRREDLRVRDMGTGSGCIAIALARALRFASVEATDISAGALGVARGNAEALKARVRFVEEDMLAAVPRRGAYDIIVSNPPYIAMSESASMERNVIGHEPHSALFVPDDDPTLFYRAVSRYAAVALAAGGDLWFEINPAFAARTRAEVAAAGFMEVAVIRDERGRERFIHARFD